MEKKYRITNENITSVRKTTIYPCMRLKYLFKKYFSRLQTLAPYVSPLDPGWPNRNVHETVWKVLHEITKSI